MNHEQHGRPQKYKFISSVFSVSSVVKYSKTQILGLR